MNEQLTELLTTLIQVVVIPAIPILVTFLPTKRLIKVDLPTLGIPIIIALVLLGLSPFNSLLAIG